MLTLHFCPWNISFASTCHSLGTFLEYWSGLGCPLHLSDAVFTVCLSEKLSDSSLFSSSVSGGRCMHIFSVSFRGTSAVHSLVTSLMTLCLSCVQEEIAKA